MAFVFSTMTGDVAYTDYQKNADGRIVSLRKIIIKGGSGILNKNLITPQGAIMTKISDEDLSILEKNPVFLSIKKRGSLPIGSQHKTGKRWPQAEWRLQKNPDRFRRLIW